MIKKVSGLEKNLKERENQVLELLKSQSRTEALDKGSVQIVTMLSELEAKLKVNEAETTRLKGTCQCKALFYKFVNIRNVIFEGGNVIVVNS